MNNSIFQEYYKEQPFYDRLHDNKSEPVDIIIPVFHTNELWYANLLSMYRNIPVNRLLIGDAGCNEEALTVLKKFPRVEIFDHKEYLTLGYSIRKLIEEVTTDWFIYLHSDVYIPKHWFDKMVGYRAEYDWFECYQNQTFLVEQLADYGNYLVRPGGGSHMGRKEAFKNVLPEIDDDFVYRTEDYVIIDRLRKNGYSYGIADTYHYHQIMPRTTDKERKVSNIHVEMKLSREEELRTWRSQFNAAIKYFEPTPENLGRLGIFDAIDHLIELGEFNWQEIRYWVLDTNPKWVHHIQKYLSIREVKYGIIKPIKGIIENCKKHLVWIYHKV